MCRLTLLCLLLIATACTDDPSGEYVGPLTIGAHRTKPTIGAHRTKPTDKPDVVSTLNENNSGDGAVTVVKLDDRHLEVTLSTGIKVNLAGSTPASAGACGARRRSASRGP